MVKGIWLRLMGDPPLVVFVLSLSLGPHQMHPHGKEKRRIDLAGTQTFHEILTPISHGLFLPSTAGRRGIFIQYASDGSGCFVRIGDGRFAWLGSFRIFSERAGDSFGREKRQVLEAFWKRAGLDPAAPVQHRFSSSGEACKAPWKVSPVFSAWFSLPVPMAGNKTDRDTSRNTLPLASPSNRSTDRQR